MPLDHATLESADAAKCKLAEEVLRSFGNLRLRVTGLSMIPSVWPGDLLLIRRQEISQIFPGDIVLFARDGRFIAHRVMVRTDDHETTRLITRGDALPAEDPAMTAAELLGKVPLFFAPGSGSNLERGRSLGARLMAGLVSCSGRVASVFVRLHTMRKHSRRKQKALCKR